MYYKAWAYAYNDEWILENANSFKNHREVWREYCRHFGDEIGYETFRKHLLYALNIPSRVTFTEDEKSWMREHGRDYESIDELTEAYNNHFSKNKSYQSVFNLREKVGLSKKYKPIGSIYDNGREYVIKVSRGAKGHLRYSRYVFEQEYGKLPNGYNVIHLDNNSYNNDINNLVAVPNSWLGTMQQYGWFSKERKFTITAVMWCELRAVLKSGERMIPDLTEQIKENNDEER